MRVLLAGVVCGAWLAAIAPAASSAKPIGFNVPSATPNDPISDAELARRSAQAGASMQRFTISWKVVQPSASGGFDWSLYDQAYNAIVAKGIKPLPIVADAPVWADGVFACTGDHCPPDASNFDDWYDFVAAVATRYPQSAAIEVWNAANTRAWWDVIGGPDPEGYAKVFSVAARAIENVDATMPILFGSLGYSYRGDLNGKILSIPTFLRGFYKTVDRSVLDHRDGLSLLLYPVPREFPEMADTEFELNQARGVMDQQDPGREIWIQEAGISTTNPAGVTEADQARDLPIMIDYFLDQPDVASVIIHTLFDNVASDPVQPQEFGYGLIRRPVAGPPEPKPAFCVLTERAGTPAADAGCPPYDGGGGDGGGGGGDGGDGGDGGGDDGDGGGGDPDPPRCTIKGTRGDDALYGSPDPDVICGGRGADIIRGSNGDDVVMGGRGNDLLRGENGKDRLRGGGGRDTLYGSFEDRLNGGKGRDEIVRI